MKKRALQQSDVYSIEHFNKKKSYNNNFYTAQIYIFMIFLTFNANTTRQCEYKSK